MCRREFLLKDFIWGGERKHEQCRGRSISVGASQEGHLPGGSLCPCCVRPRTLGFRRRSCPGSASTRGLSRSRKDRIAHTVGQLLTSGLAVCFEYLESISYSSHVILAWDPLALPVPVHDITSEHGILEPLLSHPRAPSQGPLCARILCHFSPRSTRQGAASGSPCCCAAAGLQGRASRHAGFRNAQPGSGSPPSPCPALSVSFLSIHLAL